MLTINRIKIEGFSSIVNELELEFKSKGLTVINGQNGVGKTTIFSALSWALYGQSLKEKSTVLTWEEIRPKDYRGCKVEVELHINDKPYHIIRCLDWQDKVEGVRGGNRLLVYPDDDVPKGQREVKAYLIDKLGYSFDLFRNSIAFGQKAKRIIEESNGKRKEILEQALDISFIRDALASVEKEHKELRLERDSLESELNEVEEKLEEAKDELSSAKEAIQSFEAEKQSDIDDCENEISELKAKKADLNFKNTIGSNAYKGLLAEHSKLEDKIASFDEGSLNDLRAYVKSFEDVIKGLKKQKSKADEQLNTESPECEYCGKKLLEDEYKKLRAKALLSSQELEGEIAKNAKLLNGAKKKLDKAIEAQQDELAYVLRLEEVEDKLEAYRKEEARIEANKTLASDYEDAMHRMTSRISRIKTRSLDIDLIKLKDKVSSVKKQRKLASMKFKSVEARINTLNWLRKEPLSSGGIKAYMLDQMLVKINSRLQQYSKYTGFEVEFGVDMESRYKDFFQFIYKNGIDKPYHDLSGGQKQLVDVVTALAIEDITSEALGCNIVLMDEVFESLSLDNIEIVGNLISEKARSKGVYLVTHRDEFQPSNSQRMQISLENNSTVIRIG